MMAVHEGRIFFGGPLVNIMKIVLIEPPLLFVVATVIPLLRINHRWIRVPDFPRIQIAVTGIALIVLCLCFWKAQRV